MHEAQEYIDHPNETLHVEYKRWLDLTSHEHRAAVARHIAAIANHGGGFIVFGFEDDTLASSGPNTFSDVPYSRDGIASITKKYLDPSIHCDVLELSDGRDMHKVIVVPSHGSTPVCAKANGPIVEGKTKGIVKGTYYLRKAGPESAPIDNPADWAEVIRRCVTHDRTALLGALGAALSSPRETKKGSERLIMWHDAGFRTYRKYAVDNLLPHELFLNSVQLSYLIETADQETLPKSSLKETLRQANAEIRDRVNTGWSLFFPFDRAPIAPYFSTDEAVGDGEQFLEENLLQECDGGPDGDFWRVSDDGRATNIRPIRTDFLTYHDWSEAKYLSPNRAARELGELVRHAEALSARYREAQRVWFRCEWRGLMDRMISDPDAMWSPGRVARTNKVVAHGNWPVIALSSKWPEIVSELLSPLLRVFDPSFSLSADWVESEARNWRPIGDHYP